ncbi:MAG: hypothetical protein Q7S40_19155 [Opitutaceae bacterium]|nr:hypothetical protein [Opitutaceae bacterium]
MKQEQKPSGEHCARPDRVIYRQELKRKIEELGGIIGGAGGEAPSEVELAFLERVLTWENGPLRTHREWLSKHCLFFSRPQELGGHQLHAELWRLIDALAMARVFLYHTNHLSDTELYAALWNEVLEASAPDMARTPDDGCHWDFADAGGSGEQVWLTYHATEEERQDWVREFPDVILPPRQRPPFRRDHRLPSRF